MDTPTGTDLTALLDQIRERAMMLTLTDLDRAIPPVREALAGDRSNPDYFAACMAEAALKTYHPFYRADVAILLAAVEAVLGEHAQDSALDSKFCSGCHLYWPCPTVRAIRGALAGEAGDDGQ